MFENVPPLDILMHTGQYFFAFDFGRYFVFATILTLVVAFMARTRFASRKIQAREATFADQRREFLQSLQSVLTYNVLSAFIVWGVQAGVLYKQHPSYGWPADLALLVAMIFAHDAYFYWTHRALHHPLLYKRFHLAHHRSITPTQWAIYSFSIPEAMVQFGFVAVWQFLVPTPGWVFLSWLMFQLLRNAMGHAGFEFMPRWWLSTPLTRWINTTVHHDLHHGGSFKHNYGLYFTFWDKWMGTEHPHYREKFEEVTQRGQPVSGVSQPA